MLTIRAIYSLYSRILLEDSNEIVLILPYYETTDMVRLVLSGKMFMMIIVITIVLLDILEYT